MSDFLDHLAARAIGGDTALAPRLPSLFEPLQRAPSMPVSEESEAPARPRDVNPAPMVPEVPLSPRSLVPARESVEPPATRVSPLQRVPLAPERAATEAPREPLRSPLPVAASPAHAIAAERSGTPPAPARSTASLSPLPPRQARVAPARQEAVSMRTPMPRGALLPASSPVFAAADAASARPERSATARAVAARGESRAATTPEPVVHVSIGRLEVRAAPTAAAPSRHREEPRPSSLDDYLRQRGKATP